MQLLKYFFLGLAFMCSSYLGFLLSKKYSSRVRDLKEMKNALNIFKTKIRYTAEPLPDIFEEICIQSAHSIGSVFSNAKEYMKEFSAGFAWDKAIEESNHNFKKEDKEVLKGLGKLLGKTDVEGQVNEIEIVDQFLDLQIEKAEKEQLKNEKMYKTLGFVAGLGIVIILI